MLSSIAMGVPRFSITRDRRSSSTRRKSLPKFARARKAETTIVPFLPVFGLVAINSPFHLSELYSLIVAQSMEPDAAIAMKNRLLRLGTLLSSGFIDLAGDLDPAQSIHIVSDAAIERLGN